MIKEQSNQKDMKQGKEALLTKNKAKKQPEQKQASQSDILQQIMGLLKNNKDQDLYICFKDKRTKQIKQYSTDPSILSLDQIKISKKTENLQKFVLTELVDRLKYVQMAEETAGRKDKNAEKVMKKQAEFAEPLIDNTKNVITNIDNNQCQPDQKRMPLKNIGQNQNIEDPSKIQASQIASEQQKFGPSESNIQNLADVDFQSVMSENLGTHVDNENPRHTSTLRKVVSVIEKENDIQVSQFLNEAEESKQEHKFLSHSKKLHDDNMCPLGIIAQESRVDFAQKHLFRNGFKNQPEDEEIDDEEYSQEDDSCFTAEDESLVEANLTDLSHSHPDGSLDTNQLHHSDESVEIMQGTGTHNHSYPIGSEQLQPTMPQNIDMFMACCDWEAAIQEERETSQKDENENDHNQQRYHQLNSQETQQLDNNNGTEGDRMKQSNITNHQIKACKRKIKSDLKSRNTLESLNSHNNNNNIQKSSNNESQVAKEPEIDIDSMMKKTPPNDLQRRAQKRILQQRGKKRSPSKQFLKRRYQQNNPKLENPQESNLHAHPHHHSQLQLNIEHLQDTNFDHKRLKGSLSPLIERNSRKSSQI